MVARLAAAEYVPQLVALLGSPDVSVRTVAAAALGEVPGEHEGTAALGFALTDEEAEVRAAAARSLGRLGDPLACPSLLGATTDPEPVVRAAAVRALVGIDNPIALARYREIVAEEPVNAVVVAAIEGLGCSGMDQDLTLLMSLCLSRDHEVAKAAARALEGYAAHRATAALLGLLDHPRWDVRRTAAEVLGRRADDTAVDPLCRARDMERDELVREAVTGALRALSRGLGAGRSS
jgi:HEAT repeat protein